MKRSITIEDLALRAGVSVATVSRALNGKADVSAKTRDRIVQLAKELNYHPNNQAVHLRKNQTFQTVGLVVPLVNHAFFSDVIKGVLSEAHKNNYMVLVGESQHSNLIEKEILDNFINIGVRGIIMAPGRDCDFHAHVHLLKQKQKSLVIIDRMTEGYAGHFVINNDRMAAQAVVQHLIDNGYQRIAHIGSKDASSVGTQRTKGYLNALQINGLEVHDNLIQHRQLNDMEHAVWQGYDAAKEFFELPQPPDAIFCVTDDVALGIYRYAYEKRILIPNQLGVAGFGNLATSHYLNPTLTTVNQNNIAMGELAFEFLIQSLKHTDKTLQKVFPTEVIVRESSVRRNN